MSATFAAAGFGMPAIRVPRLPVPRALHACRTRLLGLCVALAVTLGGLLPGLVGRAGAATVEGQALHIAASKRGDPYRWGATGPDAFDCSGLTYYAFRHAGFPLWRTAQQQYDQVRHISRAQRHPGDLVFFHDDSGDVYHVGVYAGGGRIWHAPHPGAVVRLERIWTGAVWYGRVG
jgi:cell wall-associated NlpC family hydrolase